MWNRLERPIIGLAPMDGITDAAFREITARHGGPDVCFTEFVSVERIVRGHDHDLTELDYGEAERPVVAQVFGTEPSAFYRVAHIVCELGFDGIDINMGCPAKSIASRGAGAGLIRTPDLATRIIRETQRGVRDWAEGRRLEEIGLPDASVAAVRRVLGRRGAPGGAVPRDRWTIPVSVKTRLGYDREIVDAWVSTLLAEGPAAIALHGRTLEQQYRGRADWDSIGRAAEIARESPTLILGNGDLQSTEDIVTRIRQTGVHGVLLGRVTLGYPWIFRVSDMIRTAAAGSEAPPADPTVSVEERIAVALEHARLFDRMRGARSFRLIRKYLSAYIRGFPNAVLLRRQLAGVDTLEDAQRLLLTPAGFPPAAVVSTTAGRPG